MYKAVFSVIAPLNVHEEICLWAHSPYYLLDPVSVSLLPSFKRKESANVKN